MGTAATIQTRETTPDTVARQGEDSKRTGLELAAAGVMPGRRRGKETARAYAIHFYTDRVVPQGPHRHSQHRVEVPRDGVGAPMPGRGALLLTPP